MTDVLKKLEMQIRNSGMLRPATGTDEDSSHIVADQILMWVCALQQNPDADLDDPVYDSKAG